MRAIGAHGTYGNYYAESDLLWRKFRTIGHRQVPVEGFWGRIECDEGVAEAVRLILSAGYRTWVSCQWSGPGKFPAYINPHGPRWDDPSAQDGAIDRYPEPTLKEMADIIGLKRGEWRGYNGVIWFKPFLRGER